MQLPRGWDSAAAALAGCARALGDPRDDAALAVESGLAFTVAVDRRLTPAGPHGTAWREELTASAERLGCRWRLVASASGEPLEPMLRDEAFALCAAGAEAGRPTLIFGVQVAEFGLAVGVEESELIVSGMLDGAGAPRRLARDALGGFGILFALQLVERTPVEPRAAALSALRRFVLAHRGGVCARGDVATGAAAWRQITLSLDGGDVDPSGLAYLAQRQAEARARIAAWLPAAAAATGVDLSPVERAARRSAAMLAELARLHPYPPPPTEMLTTTRREQTIELFREAALAEEAAVVALQARLLDEERRRAVRDLRVTSLDSASLPALFACVDEIPIEGLRREAAACRDRLAPSLGGVVDGRLLWDAGRLIGHVLWAPLEEARYPVAASGRRWFVFCPWLESSRRGRGLGGALFAALDAAARSANVDGLLTVATSIDVYLHHRGYEHHGFVEVDRRGDTRLLERRLTDAPSEARLVDPPPPRAGGSLPLLVRHAYNCPLLLRVRRDAADVGRLTARVAVDEADATRDQPCGIAIGGRAVAHGPVPAPAIAQGLVDEADRWR